MTFPEDKISEWLDDSPPKSWFDECTPKSWPPQWLKDFVEEHHISERGKNFFLNRVWTEQEESYKQGFEDCLKLFTAAKEHK